MSKAFTREDDASEKTPLPPLPTLPPGVKNYITQSGEAKLRADLESLLEKRSTVTVTADRGQIDQRIARLQQILSTLVPVARPASECENQVCFGATVTVRYSSGDLETYRIVGINEIDLDRDWISWQSPLARALLNAKVGDTVRFKAPAGEQQLLITDVRYES
jgi:transcription elongation factor GreB